MVLVRWWCGGGAVLVLPALACDMSVEGRVVKWIGGEHGQGDVGVLEGGGRGQRKAYERRYIGMLLIYCLSENSCDVCIIQVHWGDLGHLGGFTM